MKKNKPSFWRPFTGLLILLISSLFLVAISVNIISIFDDYRTLQAADLDLYSIFRLDFPKVINPIGPFGVFFGYWLIVIFGKFLSISLLLATGLLGFFSIFFPKDKNLFGKVICFLLFSFFLNLTLFIINDNYTVNSGFLPLFIYQLMLKLFHSTGTLIISLMIVVANLLIIFEVSNVIKFFMMIFLSILSVFKAFFRVFRKKNKKIKIKPEKNIKSGKNIIAKPDITVPAKVPNITDHVDRNSSPVRDTDIQRPKPSSSVKNANINSQSDQEKEYQLPEIEDFLSTVISTKKDRDDIENNIKIISTILENKLAEFGVEAEVINVNIGPIITQYEIKPAPGVKVNKFHSLADDLSLAIKATSIRVQAPIPGRGLVGIEIPNIKRNNIYLKDIILSPAMQRQESKLAFGLGKDIAGNPVVADLAQMPHLLIAGSTGSGKSVCVNTIITCLLLRTTPDEVRLIMIDPKRIELSGYEGIPHLIQNVVTNNEDALTALNWGVAEMERRYDLLQKYKVKNLKSYNEKITKLKENIAEPPEDDNLPYIIIVVDELADLMMTVGRDVERPITRLAQMARAIGIHLILATQRPSIKVITGIIKANFPSRIAFKVSTKIDSRVIIDSNGAEKLLGMGDMLFLAPGKGTAERIHGAYIPPVEIHNIVDYLKT
ncbi:MAG: DUF87 domain-containing protein, partial [Candidatus Cloacimonetes bacterium]|nr:DUF87 domain-containing protein [Candidatus Cloacimonadota bacterium]